MKKYRQLIIKGEDNDLSEIMSYLRNCTAPPFKYLKKASDDYTKWVLHSKDDVVVLKTERKSLFESYVWIYKNSDCITITNITSSTSLGLEAYNKVLSYFYLEIIYKCIEELKLGQKIQIKLTKEDVSLSDLLCEESLAKFNKWFNLCNIDDPISNLEDYNNWLSFIISIVNHNDDFIASDLIQWLKEDELWPDDWEPKIDRLAFSLAFGKDLLKKYIEESIK